MSIFFITTSSGLPGYLAEYLIINQLRFHAYRQQDLFLGMMHNLPEDFRFVRYDSVWKYKTIPSAKQELELDIFAKAPEGEYSLVWEVKNRDTKAFNREEAEDFLRKTQQLIEREQLSKAVPIVFSLTGFTEAALSYFTHNNIAWNEETKWLGED